MNKKEKFISFLQGLKTKQNASLIEGVISGFNVLHEGHEDDYDFTASGTGIGYGRGTDTIGDFDVSELFGSESRDNEFGDIGVSGQDKYAKSGRRKKSGFVQDTRMQLSDIPDEDGEFVDDVGNDDLKSTIAHIGTQEGNLDDTMGDISDTEIVGDARKLSTSAEKLLAIYEKMTPEEKQLVADGKSVEDVLAIRKTNANRKLRGASVGDFFGSM